MNNESGFGFISLHRLRFRGTSSETKTSNTFKVSALCFLIIDKVDSFIQIIHDRTVFLTQRRRPLGAYSYTSRVRSEKGRLSISAPALKFRVINAPQLMERSLIKRALHAALIVCVFIPPRVQRRGAVGAFSRRFGSV